MTVDEINSLASRKGVRRNAVENFLGTLGNAGGIHAEIANLRSDALSYKWNAATVKAIETGIKKAYGVVK